MGSIRKMMAAMLMLMTFAAFQSEAYAQTRRNESRTATRTSRQAGSSSNVKKSTPTRQTAARPSSQTRPGGSKSGSTSISRPSRNTAVKANGSGMSSDRKPSTTVSRPSSSKPSVSRPMARPGTSDKQAGTRPSVRPDKGPGDRPADRPSGRPGDRPSDRPGKGHKPDVRPDDRPGKGHGHGPGKPVQIRPDHKDHGPRVHPRDRDFMSWRTPAHFWSRHHHCYGHRVRVLPRAVHRHYHHGVTYYCYDNIWYRPYGGYYVVCRPPFGTVLAAEFIADMAWAAVNMSYYYTVLNAYDQINDNNRYIAEQNAVIAQNNAVIAAQNTQIAMNQSVAEASYVLANELGLVQSYAAAGTEYFYQDGVFYVKDSNGEYKVIVPPAGALVETLPEDYDMITLNDGNEYYKVDDTVCRVTIVDGKPYFEVLGQLIA